MPRRASELDHERLWAAIDAIAVHNGLTPSALARRAGLDPTAFNKSKRVTGDGRPRWPSTESIAKILEATGAGLIDFVRLVAGPDLGPVPVDADVAFAAPSEGDSSGFAEDGRDVALRFPGGGGEPLFAYEVADEAALPLYRPGDVLIASGAARIRKGDRVLLRTRDGRVRIGVFHARTSRACAFAPATPEGEGLRVAAKEVLWIARILWASQ